jgi:hypothetical protein
MELLLWLWFYDHRWFFNIKFTIFWYKNAWLLPLFLHLFSMSLCIYFLQISEVFKCDESLVLWLQARTFFSFLISLNIILFKFKIQDEYNEEITYFDSAKKVYPILSNQMKHYDFWIRRKSLISATGVFLFVLGMISLFWSYLIISFYHFHNYYKYCDVTIQRYIRFHSLMIFIGNVPIILLILLLVAIKLGAFMGAYLCPSWSILISKYFNSEKPKIEINKYAV